MMILFSIALPGLAGILLLAFSFAGAVGGGAAWPKRPEGLHLFVGIVLAVSAGLALAAAWTGGEGVALFALLDGIPVYFRADEMSRLFVPIVSIVWLAAGFFSFVYMKREGKERRYFGFYLLLYSVLLGLDFSGNLVTMYLFYELVTLVSAPLVLHSGSREAVMAALKYLFYSMCGAYAGLFGIFFLYRYCDTLIFAPGGSLNLQTAAGHEGILLTAVFVMLTGFGAKAGMLPLHAWLPTAHPQAPSPASAVLSGVIVKAGVLAMIRAVFYVTGADFIRGTWVQYAWMSLALLTVFMGSMLAFREQGLKKRLAYSTVSQVSYILFGLSLLSPDAFAGALLHTAVHALVKCGLFLTAGVFLWQFGFRRVDQLAGVGKRMPVTMWCYTIFALALIGIPPTGGFLSKWYLAEGALKSGTGAFSWLGPVTLLVSALLTAGYLLPVTLRGFFAGEDAGCPEPGGRGAFAGNGAEDREQGELVERGLPAGGRECSLCMLLPLVLLAALAVLSGVWPGPLTRFAADTAAGLL